ncbi:hypothetical protein E4U39_003946 [Claviceps sp. Clav50 group G5]|nr:hypothetical protein E4U39_003946 [Claviceps sp. Clav50 group G5]
MADIQNPVELPKEDAAAAPAVEATTEAPAAAVEATEETKAAQGAEVKTEDKPAEEIKPVEEGHLSHKAQGASFPKNLIPSKEFFSFGTEALEPKALAAYLRTEKNTENAHHNISWASHTGNGLLFMGDKKAPSNVINLADTTEPETDGANKFHFTHKGAKHSFKAANAAERDSWVAQLKIKMAEAKELAATVSESEAYKNALQTLKPAAKEEAPVEEAAQTEEAPKAEETPATETDAAAAAPATEDKPAEEPKRRSVSRKRASIFGFGRKESKKEETKAEEAPAAEVEAVVPAAEPAAAALNVEETPAVEGAAAATEDKAAEEAVESPKPLASKRNSFFGNVFAKKEKKVTEAKPTEEAVEETTEVATDAAAPVIPPVEETTPINAEEVNAAADNTEAAEPAAKKDVKEKRKSALPFAFGRREKASSPAEGEEKRETQSPFSKLRATIKSKTGGKTEEKAAEETAKDEAAAPAIAEEAAAVDAAAETAAETKADAAAPAVATAAA